MPDALSGARQRADADLSFLSGGGAAGAAIRAHDWASSPLGDPHSWPPALRTAVALMLHSPHPTWLGWGLKQTVLYNDGCLPMLGEKHPRALGMPARELWAGAWDAQIAAALRGEAPRHEDEPRGWDPRGRGAPTFSWSFAPLRGEEGRVQGFFSTAVATTTHVAADAGHALDAERWRQLLDQAPSVIAIYRGADLVLDFCNAAHRELLNSHDWVDRSAREVLPKRAFEILADRAAKVMQSGRRMVFSDQPVAHWSMPHNKPEIRYVDNVMAPLIGPDGVVNGVFLESFDVTERRAAQDALRASEEQLRLAAEAAEVGLWDYDLVTQTVSWQLRVKTMFGIPPDAAVRPEDCRAALHPDDCDQVLAAFNAARDPELRAVYDVEHRTIGQDGVVRWVATKGRGVFDRRGDCVRMIGAIVDVTERKRAEARLNELNETLERRVAEALAERKLLADIVENTDAFVQVADLDYRWLAINRAAADECERIFGRRPTVGAHIVDAMGLRPKAAAAVKARWDRAFAGEEFTEQGMLRHPELGERFYEMKFNVLRDKDGRQIGAYEFSHDVTDRLRDQARLVETEAALRQVQKLEAMGQLTGGVAHDFNNLLTPIVGGLDMLQRRELGGPREQRIIAGALQSAERAKTLVQRLLAFARRQPLQPCAVDVAALIRGMADLVASTTGPQIRVTVDIAPDLPPAQADANQLEMAILNLSVNARDAMLTGGALRISADVRTVAGRHPTKLAPGRYVRISVADTGAGMDPAVAARAIEPFFSTKGVGKGTGLGLSMAHGLASQLGGALTISSQLGVGTNVELWLPQSPEALAAGDAAAASRAGRGQAGRVLLVDDEELVRLSAADMLAEIGFEVVEAGSAEQALRMLDEGLQFDVLVTDHLMPGMTGVDLAYIVRERRPGVRILVVSGFAETEGVAPDLPRLNKPFRQADLAAKLGDSGR